ncbi:hypothetical protein ONE63_001044 [Megalurothrips usitatus]|uniref:Uncharacterized protein n=1 Tax=Megalurothrips usitatus TaxID=439358 RepID=A0AAV7XD06_9NEOP|nr:hypothetical protein ONE63_001044 [Megalurothrips usitatus]
MKTVLEARKLKLQKFGLTDQPLPIIVGPLEKIERCLVKFDSCEYIVESPLKAIDVAFKSFHALHATYPAESEPMWLFLQKGIYKFKTKWDRHFDSVENVVQTYANFKE